MNTTDNPMKIYLHNIALFGERLELKTRFKEQTEAHLKKIYAITL